jgi:hypothetical protein
MRPDRDMFAIPVPAVDRQHGRNASTTGSCSLLPCAGCTSTAGLSNAIRLWKGLPSPGHNGQRKGKGRRSWRRVRLSGPRSGRRASEWPARPQPALGPTTSKLATSPRDPQLAFCGPKRCVPLRPLPALQRQSPKGVVGRPGSGVRVLTLFEAPSDRRRPPWGTIPGSQRFAIERPPRPNQACREMRQASRAAGTSPVTR